MGRRMNHSIPGLILVGIPAGLTVYTYAVYPLLLRALARRGPVAADDPDDWPLVSVSLPAYNEAGVIRDTLETWLAVDYPRDRLQMLVVSDASTDGTDDIVREYAGRGVELLRLEGRSGKTAAENAAAPHLRGEIIINTDASVRVRPDAIKPLVRAFLDPSIGVASGRDVSVGSEAAADNAGETGYVGYEMWIRSLETRTGGIIGASGCFYAIRSDLHRAPLPEHLSRDFASALTARDHGYRAVSVDEAVCLVPRAGSLRAEYRRKVRTMARGLETLFYKRHLLNPFRHGSFAWKLISHKLCRWLVPVTLPLALAGLVLLAPGSRVAAVLLGLAVAGVLLGVAGFLWPEDRGRPRPIALAGFAFAANLAALRAWVLAIHRREGHRIWEPTRRPAPTRASDGSPPG